MTTNQVSPTERRDLRTGRPIWLDRRKPTLGTQRLEQDAVCGVLVIGAGISGALIAEALSEAGHDVIVMDRRGPAMGSTPASTAMLQYELDTPLSLMSDRIGQDRAARIWRRSRLAVDALRERTERLRLDVGAATRGSVYLDGNILDPAGLAREADARRRAGFEVELIGPAETERRYGIPRRHAIIGHGNYIADPRRLTIEYLRVAQAAGCRIHAPCEASAIEPHDRGVTVRTREGHVVKARHLVIATGYERLKGIPSKGNYIMSTWSIATAPQPKAIWPGADLIWEASDPYLYIRTTPDGAVICGGEDEPFDDEERRDAMIGAKAERLATKLGRLLPGLDPTPAYAWTGSFGNSPVGTPTVGRIPRMPNCYAAMGYGGNGITFSMMAAQLLRGLLGGYGDCDAELFSFYRPF